ncbi:MAG: DinB family protein [Vicinamibacterales bacterium]
MAPELRAYLEQLAAIERDARRLLDGLTDAQLTWRETHTTWSVADCLNHLLVTGGHSTKAIRRALADARSRRLTGSGPFRHGMVGNWFVRLMDAPPGVKFKAPKAYRPELEMTVAEIVTGFFGLQQELTRILSEADGIDLARTKVDNPVMPWFRLSLGQEFALTMAHERRHVWQAWRVREKMLNKGRPDR